MFSCSFFFSVITHTTLINDNINDNKGVPGPLTNNQGPLITTRGHLTDNQGAPRPLTENQGAHNWRPGGPRAPNQQPRGP